MKKVFVGLSGGVDSAVSAALLKEFGHAVTGVFIKIWQPEFIACTWKDDRLDAMRVCAALDIPFREIDLSEEYRRNVVERMVADYAHGITPNPDILCNRHIKFGAYKAWALAQGADAIATGHYARITQDRSAYQLKRGTDTGKDQSYFLYALSQDDLAHAMFPVGGMQKARVRKAARDRRLPVAHKPDSQGLCFVGDITLRDFLSRYIDIREGAVLAGGVEIGRHEGAALYTVGQRHGFRSATGGPYYVVSVDIPNNKVHVAKERDAAMRTEARVDAMHWIAGRPPVQQTRALAQTRYRESPAAVAVGGDTHVRFERPHLFAHGQSIVLYDDDTCLGGGVITS